MSHAQLYRKGKITLKQYKYLQGLELAAKRGSKKAAIKYKKEEERIG